MVFYAVVPLVVGLGLASILNRAKVRGLGFFRTVVFLPQVVAMVVVAVAWRRIYAPDGTLNALLSAVGLGSLTRGLAGRLHPRAAGGRLHRHVVRDGPGHGAAPGRDGPDLR